MPKVGTKKVDYYSTEGFFGTKNHNDSIFDERIKQIDREMVDKMIDESIDEEMEIIEEEFADEFTDIGIRHDKEAA